jgi:hypothetical protein
VGDEDKLAAWLAEEVCPVELSEERLREALVARCRVERIEPPAPSRLERVLGTARAAAELRFTAQVSSRLTTKAVAGLEALVAETDAEGAGESGLLAEIKADPGKRNIETLVIETEKLARVKAICLPAELFTESSEKLVDAWRARAARLYPSDLRASPAPVRLTLLAALCWARQTEIIDGLVDLLITLVHKVDVTAERKVGGEMLDDLRRVRGKQGLLFALAEAALDHPDDTVRDALYPVVSEATLKDLVAEAKANDTAFRQRVRTVLRSSYSSHYRRMLPKLLAALEFRCNNTTYRPVMDALDLLRRYTDRPARDRFCDHSEKVPVEGVVPREWADAVVDDDSRVERIPYELCVLRSLREAIRRREVYIAGATRWRNPEDDLPADFDANRDVHYAAIRQPLDPSAFVADLKARLGAALTRLDQGIAAGTTGGVKITTRRGEPWIHVPPTPAVPEPTNLLALKAEVERRWGVLDLLDILKEADFDTRFTEEFTSVASREITDRAVLRRRLLLVLFGLGTNVGIRHVAGGEGGESEAMLRRVRRLFVNRDNLRRAVTRLVNATFAVRDEALWGQGRACASDSKKFGSWSSNFLTEYHVR